MSVCVAKYCEVEIVTKLRKSVSYVYTNIKNSHFHYYKLKKIIFDNVDLGKA